MENHQDVVAAILDACPTTRVAADLEEQAKAQVTRVAAHAMHQMNPDIGLLRKTSGNQMLGLSVDVVMDRSDGSWADCASATADEPGYVRITAPWSPHEGTDHAESHEAWLARWVQPTAALAASPGPLAIGIEEPPTPPSPPPPPPVTPVVPPGTPGPNTLKMLQALGAQMTALSAQVTALEKKGDENTEKILATLRSVAKDLAKQVRVLLPFFKDARPK